MKQDIEEGYLDLLYAFPFHYHFLFLFEVVTRCGFDRYQMGLSSKALHETRVFCSGSNKRYRRGISSSQAHLQGKEFGRHIPGKRHASTMCQIGTSVRRRLWIPSEYFQKQTVLSIATGITEEAGPKLKVSREK